MAAVPSWTERNDIIGLGNKSPSLVQVSVTGRQWLIRLSLQCEQSQSPKPFKRHTMRHVMIQIITQPGQLRSLSAWQAEINAEQATVDPFTPIACLQKQPIVNNVQVGGQARTK